MRRFTKNAERHTSIAKFFFPVVAVAAPLVTQGCVADAGTDAPSGSDENPAHESQGWDSQDGNPTHATHSYLTEYAIDQLSPSFPELQTYRATLVDGANRELHELPVSDPDQEQLRQEAQGTNWSADHPEVIWGLARDAYRAGNKSRAYWLVGIVLHWVEDMGVPAHALHVIHQGTVSQADNFELMALQRWSPLYTGINRVDPQYAAPSDYVTFDGAWAASDFASTWPGATYTRTFFPITWLFASSKTTTFVRNRQGRTATATTWALRSAVTHF